MEWERNGKRKGKERKRKGKGKVKKRERKGTIESITERCAEWKEEY